MKWRRCLLGVMVLALPFIVAGLFADFRTFHYPQTTRGEPIYGGAYGVWTENHPENPNPVMRILRNLEGGQNLDDTLPEADFQALVEALLESHGIPLSEGGSVRVVPKTRAVYLDTTKEGHRRFIELMVQGHQPRRFVGNDRLAVGSYDRVGIGWQIGHRRYGLMESRIWYDWRPKTPPENLVLERDHFVTDLDFGYRLTNGYALEDGLRKARQGFSFNTNSLTITPSFTSYIGRMWLAAGVLLAIPILIVYVLRRPLERVFFRKR